MCLITVAATAQQIFLNAIVSIEIEKKKTKMHYKNQEIWLEPGCSYFFHLLSLILLLFCSYIFTLSLD